MGRNSLDEVWSEEELAIIRRRETFSDGSQWKMKDWDYTEWEEFMQEIKNLK